MPADAASARAVVTAAMPGLVARLSPALRRPHRRLVFVVSTEEATGWCRARSSAVELTGVAGLDGDGGAQGGGGTPVIHGGVGAVLKDEGEERKVRGKVT
jgi:hypothetical protein